MKTRGEVTNTDSLTADLSSSQRRRLRAAKKLTEHRLRQNLVTSQNRTYKPKQNLDTKAQCLTDPLTFRSGVV